MATLFQGTLALTLTCPQCGGPMQATSYESHNTRFTKVGAAVTLLCIEFECKPCIKANQPTLEKPVDA